MSIKNTKDKEIISIQLSGLYISELSPINKLYFFEKLQQFLNDNINDDYMIYTSDLERFYDIEKGYDEYYYENEKKKFKVIQYFKIKKVGKEGKLTAIKYQRDKQPYYPKK